MNTLSRDNTVGTKTNSDMNTTGSQYLSDLNAFDIMYQSLDRPQYHDSMIKFLEEFFLKIYPKQRSRLVGIYMQ